MLSILRDRTRPLNRRLKEILTLSMDAQPLLDEDRGAELAAMAQTWQMEEREVPAGAGVFSAALRVLSSLEVLEPDWPELLRKSEHAPGRGDSGRAAGADRSVFPVPVCTENRQRRGPRQLDAALPPVCIGCAAHSGGVRCGGSTAGA